MNRPASQQGFGPRSYRCIGTKDVAVSGLGALLAAQGLHLVNRLLRLRLGDSQCVRMATRAKASLPIRFGL